MNTLVSWVETLTRGIGICLCPLHDILMTVMKLMNACNVALQWCIRDWRIQPFIPTKDGYTRWRLGGGEVY